jgi:nitrogenase molybdenum-iron protein alpha chain
MDALVHSSGDVPNFSICNLQPYQVVKILKKRKPDLLVTRHGGLAIIGSKLGIPSIFEGDGNFSVGYSGVVKFGRRLYEAWQTRAFVQNVSAHVELPYTDWWLNEEDPFYFEEGGKGK